MTTNWFTAYHTLGASMSARIDGAMRAFAHSLARGATIVDGQFGYRPSKLVIGGFVVWAICVVSMLDGSSALRDVAGLVLPGLR
jgi:hypothetical protein